MGTEFPPGRREHGQRRKPVAAESQLLADIAGDEEVKTTDIG